MYRDLVLMLVAGVNALCFIENLDWIPGLGDVLHRAHVEGLGYALIYYLVLELLADGPEWRGTKLLALALAIVMGVLRLFLILAVGHSHSLDVVFR